MAYLVTDYGAVGDGVTDDTSAIQDAINAAAVTGGVVEFPIGQFITSAPLVIDKTGVKIIGQGAGNYSYPASGAMPTYNEAATLIIATHTAGPVIRIRQQGVEIRGLKITADATREGVAFSPLDGVVNPATFAPGIWVGGDDAVGARVDMTWLQDIRVIKQPGDGVLLVGEITGSMLLRVSADTNKGHGIALDRGLRTARTNLDSPGITSIIGCRASENGGHGLALGHPDDDELPSYRIFVLNLEAFENCADSDVRYANWQVYARGDNNIITTSAFGGRSKAGVSEAHGGLLIAGRTSKAIGCRYIRCSIAVNISSFASTPTLGVEIDGMECRRDTGDYNPAVTIHAGAKNIRIRIDNITDIAALYDNDVDGLEIDQESGKAFIGSTNSGDFKSGRDLVIVDDGAASFEFDAAGTYGILILNGPTAMSGPCIVAFRVGSSVYSKLLAGDSSNAVTTGALSGTTGADGKLTVSVHTDNRLYIENRTSLNRIYTAAFLSVRGGRLLPGQ